MSSTGQHQPTVERPISDRAVADLPVRAGRADLLEEILAMAGAQAPGTPAALQSQRPRWTAPLAAAAAVAVLAGAVAWWSAGPGDPSSAPGPAGTRAQADGQEALALLEAPGWQVAHVGRAEPGGSIAYEAAGGRSLEISWYPAATYDSYVEDRRRIVDPPAAGEPIEVLGLGAQLWSYSRDDHTVIREIEVGRWLEVRAAGMGEDDYLELLGQLRLVNEAAFEEALPDDYVTTRDRAARIEEMLDGIAAAVGPDLPVSPSGRPTIDSQENSPYGLAVDVAGSITCQWLDELDEALRVGDARRVERASAVLATARDWPLLRGEVNRQGAYPEVVFQYARTAARGEVPPRYSGGLGCAQRP